ncbi:MAG: BrnA antitoxin family protein [Spirochaetales bacterium]|nr:BrnA antitoxin family protein [Spirochaetales bacterium]
MQMEKHEIQIGQKPTAEMLKEVEEAAGKPVRYTKDAPKLTSEQLAEFAPYYLVDHNVYKPRKVQISLRIDADVLEAFKSQGEGYQTRINDALRNYVFGTH